jgi:hypothetical protein
VDWNEDGTNDLLVGSRAGRVLYFEGSPSDGAPILSYVGHIEAGGSPIFVGANSAPFVIDWNEDGLHDLVMGAENKEMGSVPPSTRVYLNTGATGTPVFTGYSQIYCGSEPILPHRCIPWITDMSNDGKKDLVWGIMEGYYLYYENEGSNENPVFLAEDTLRYLDGTVIDEGTDLRPVITDWNADGVLDLLAGNALGTVIFYPGYPTGIEQQEATLCDQFGLRVENPATDCIRAFVSLGCCATVRMTVLDLCGRPVDETGDVVLAAGDHELWLDLAACPAGVYFVMVETGHRTASVPVILLH